MSATIVTFAKIDAAKQLVYGWASVAQRADGSVVVDAEGDSITADELERAAHDFVVKSGAANTGHVGAQTGHIVESFVSTPDKIAAMGLPAGSVPTGWFVGFKVTDPAAWEGVKSGRLRAFSIEGVGKRVTR
jgi:hypothetical protein